MQGDRKWICSYGQVGPIIFAIVQRTVADSLLQSMDIWGFALVTRNVILHFDTDVPFILGREGNYHVVVGQAYSDAYMYHRLFGKPSPWNGRVGNVLVAIKQ